MYDTKLDSRDCRGFTIEIHQEIDGELFNPRDWDNLGIMYCWHPDYILGDEQFSNSEFDTMNDVYDYIKNDCDGINILPLSLYEHSGITMYVGNKGEYPFDSAGWDTTHVGFIYTTPERAKEYMGMNKNLSIDEVNKIDKALKQEVKTYASYLEGDVVFYLIKDSDDEVVGSCGGYVGEDIEYIYSEAQDEIEFEITNREKEAREVQKWNERDVMTV